MNTYKIIYKDKKAIIVQANTVLEIVKKYSLATRENIETKIEQVTNLE